METKTTRIPRAAREGLWENGSRSGGQIVHRDTPYHIAFFSFPIDGWVGVCVVTWIRLLKLCQIWRTSHSFLQLHSRFFYPANGLSNGREDCLKVNTWNTMLV